MARSPRSRAALVDALTRARQANGISIRRAARIADISPSTMQGWLDGRIDDIRDYCETDVVNTYLVYLRFQQMRGQLTPAEHEDEVNFIKSHLAASPAEHWQKFLAAWG